MIVVGPDGINEIYDNPVNMYPNPVSDQLSLKAESVILNAVVYSLSGQKLVSKVNNTKTLQMDVSDLTLELMF